MYKPFFFRIDLIELMDFATEPEGLSMSLLEFSKELKSGRSNHKAIQKIIDEAHNYIEKKKNSGSIGGKIRASNAQANPSGAQAVLESAQAVLESAQANPSGAQARSSNNNIESKKPCSSSDERMADFEIFWNTFQFKKGRGGAETTWKKIKGYNQDLLCKILKGAAEEAYSRPALEANGKSPKWAQGWLTERRWEDEPTVTLYAPRRAH